MGLDLEPTTQVAALETRTEGWVAGLQLAGLSLRAGSRTPTELRRGVHRQPPVRPRLPRRGGPRHQPEHVRRFLLDTAVLRRADRAAVRRAHRPRRRQRDARGPRPRATCSSSRSTSERQWYRYHHLFADALRARLGRGAARPGPAPAPRPPASGTPRTAFSTTPCVTRWPPATPSTRPTSSSAALPDLRRQRRGPHAARVADGACRTTWCDAGRCWRTCLAWTRLVEGDLDGVEAWLGVTPSRRSRRAPPTVAHGRRSVAARSEELRTAAGDDRGLPGLGRPGPRRRRRRPSTTRAARWTWPDRRTTWPAGAAGLPRPRGLGQRATSTTAVETFTEAVQQHARGR